MKKILPIFASIPLLWSCEQNLDFDMIEDLSVSPSLSIPVVDATLTIGDLVTPEDTLLQVGSDDALSIYYKQDSIFDFGVADLLEIPDQDPTSVELNNVLTFLQVGQSLGTIAGAELEEVTFADGQLELELISDTILSGDLNFRISINNSDLGGSPFTANYILPQGSLSNLDSASMQNLIIDFTNGGVAVNFIDVSVEILNPSVIPDNKTIEAIFRFKDLDIYSATGNFGNRIELVPAGDFEFSVNGLEEFTSGFFLTDPKIELTATSNVGLPLDIDLNLQGVNANSDIEGLGAETFSLVPPVNIGDFQESTLSINKNNSNIVNFMAILPNKILYSGQAEVNPDGPPTVPNFVTNDASVSMDLEVEIPLAFRAVDMSFEQIINASLLPEDFDTEQINELAIYFRTVNGIPFDLNLDVAFLDSISGDSLTGFNFDLLTVPVVDQNGEVIQPSIDVSSIVFTKEQIEKLTLSSQIRLRASLNSANGGQTEARLFTHNDLRIQISLDGNFSIQPLNNED